MKMSKKLIVGASIWSPEWDNPRENLAVLFDQDQIHWVGAKEDAPISNQHEVIDGMGKLITPGLLDCHTHLVFGGDRATEFSRRLGGVSYAQIAAEGGGIAATVQATREATEEQLYASALGRIRDLCREGVTGIEIKSGYGLDTHAELKLLRVIDQLKNDLPVTIRATYLGAHTIPVEYKADVDGYVDQVCTDLQIFHEQGLVDHVDAYCEHIAFSVAQVRRIFETAHRHNIPVKLHADQLSDMSAAQLAAEFKALSAEHLEYTSQSGVQALARAGTVAVLLPMAYYFLRESQLPPVDWMREARLPIAIATDCNPGTAPCSSLLSAMHMACSIFRLTPLEVLRGVTVHAAMALGIENPPSIQTGNPATFAIWNTTSLDHLCYWLGGNKLWQSYNNGVLLCDGSHLAF